MKSHVPADTNVKYFIMIASSQHVTSYLMNSTRHARCSIYKKVQIVSLVAAYCESVLCLVLYFIYITP